MNYQPSVSMVIIGIAQIAIGVTLVTMPPYEPLVSLIGAVALAIGLFTVGSGVVNGIRD